MSLLIERFAATTSGVTPEIAEREIIQCVKTLRRRIGLRAVAPSRLDPFLASRGITDVTTDNDLKADGALVPLGEDLRAGFRMILRRDLPEGRINFTVAHEICHTFFYERAPEIKFASHAVDPEEERLCNCGAEEILIPAFDLKRRIKHKPISLDTLQTLADHYRVSLPAMFVRLRKLDLWNAELVLWHQMTNGSFAVKRVWGGKLIDWQWLNNEIPRTALSVPAGTVASGTTCWALETNGGFKLRPVSYQLKRHGREVLVLVLRKQKRPLSSLIPQQYDLFLKPLGRKAV